MRLTPTMKKALDKALKEVDRWKRAAQKKTEGMTPAELRAHYAKVSQWWKAELAKVRRSKKSQKRRVRAAAR